MFAVKHVRREELPALAWCARIDSQGRVTVTCGRWVENDDHSAFEGAWSGRYAGRNFSDAMTFTGTGLSVFPDRIIAATPTHTLQALYSIKEPASLLVGNSLACVMASAGTTLDPTYRYYDHDLMSVMAGLLKYVRYLPTRGSRHGVRIHYHANIEVSPDLEIKEKPKNSPLPFQSYDQYYDFLKEQVLLVTLNAADPGRSTLYRPVTTVSSGYDSPTCAVLAKTAGCKEAITFTTARRDFADREDSGREIARSLHMKFAEVNPLEYRSRTDFPEVEFASAMAGGEDVVFANLETVLPRVLLFTGYHGDKVWSRAGHRPNRELIRGDPSGGSLSEFRLRVGFINFPVPFVGAIDHPSIHEVSNSSEMRTWSRGGEYDRPIPRRIVEGAGVPGYLFGQNKKAVSLPYQTTVATNPPLDEWLTPTSRLDFAEFLKANPIFASRWDERKFRFLHALYRLNSRALGKATKIAKRSRLLGLVLPRKGWVPSRYAKNRTEHMMMFQWAIEKMLERYESAIQSKD